MAGGGSGLSEGEPEFQIAPMIDVLLVLLIFFMSIATTAVTRYDQKVNLPEVLSAGEKKDSVGEGVFNLYWNARENRAQIVFEEQEVSAQRAMEILEERRKAVPGYRILIRADRDTPVAYVHRIMEAAARAGVLDVTFAATQRR